MVKYLFIATFDLLIHTEQKDIAGCAPILRRCKQAIQLMSHASLEYVFLVHAPIFCWPYISYLCLSEFLQTGLGPLSVLV